MLFIETSIFSKHLADYLDDDEYRLFQIYLMDHPEKGDVIKGSGGVRKIRWAIKGKGKSGGVRVIYYWQQTINNIWLLTLYRKNEVESIPAHILKEIAKEITHEKERSRSRDTRRR